MQNNSNFKTKIYPWIVVGLLWVVALLNYMDRQMLSTMRSAMAVDIAELATAEKFGALMAIFLWIYGCVSPFGGAVADRISRKWLIISSLDVWSAVTLLMGYCTSYNQIYALRALMGVSEALYIPAGLSLISDYHEGKSRSFAIGIHMTGLYIGQAAGGFGAGLAEAFTWQSTFFWFGVIGLAYGVILSVVLQDKKDETPAAAAQVSIDKVPVLKGFSIIFANISFWVMLFFFASLSLPGWATKNWLPTLFSDTLSIPMTKAGPISTITIAASSFIGVMLGGPISDRWVKKNLRGRIYTSTIGFVMMIPSLVLLGLGHNLTAVVLAGVLFGVGYGMIDTNNMPILCQFVPKRLRGTAYGVMNMVGVFAGALCTSALGKLADAGKLPIAFALMAIIVAAALTLELTVLKPTTDNME